MEGHKVHGGLDLSIGEDPEIESSNRKQVHQMDDEEASIGGEPNVVDITDDFDNQSQKSKFENAFETRRQTVQVKKSDWDTTANQLPE